MSNCFMESEEVKRAVRVLRNIGGPDFYGLAINALERQIPQEAVGEEGYPNCPKCGTGLIGEYCYECGQRTLKPWRGESDGGKIDKA